MKDRKLEKSDVHPSVANMSYAEITDIFGVYASHVAKLMGVKKDKKSSKKESKD